MENLSEHVSYFEGIKSNTATKHGLDNNPNSEQLAKMKMVAEKCFEPLRNHLGVPIMVTSFFRGPELNSKGENHEQRN